MINGQDLKKGRENVCLNNLTEKIGNSKKS